MDSKVSPGLKLMVVFVVLSEQTVLFILPTIIVYMIEFLLTDSNGKKPDPSTIAYTVALIEGLNRTGIIIGAFFWGYISDIIGRKNSLTCTIIGFSLTSIGFGLSTNIYTAIFWRICSGLFSGSINILKATISDLSTDKNISVLYSFFSTGFGISSILGPVLAGLFSRPYETFPNIFDNHFFHTFPYFLPFAINLFVDAIGLTIVLINVPSNSKKIKIQIPAKALLKNKNYIFAVIVFSIHACAQFAFRSIMPLWIKSDKESGGLGWDSEQETGLMNSLSGLFVAIIPIFLTPRLSAKLGLYKSLYVVEMFLIPFMILPVLSVYFKGNWVWVVLILTNGLNVCLSTIFISLISITISNSVEFSITGLAIGISQTFAETARTLSAFGAPALFGKISSLDLKFPFNSRILFFFITCLLFSNCLIIYNRLNSSVETRIQDTEDNNGVEITEKSALNKAQ